MKNIQNLEIKKQRSKHIRFMTTGFILILLVMGILNKGLSLNPNTSTTALVGKKAKNFQVPLIQASGNLQKKQILTLEDFKGKPIILNFWASWCYSCREEAAIVESFWKKHQHENVAVVGIAIQDNIKAASEFARAYGKTYVLALDEKGDAGINYGITGVPETFFIDKNGVIVHKIAGPVNDKILEYWHSKIALDSSTG